MLIDELANSLLSPKRQANESALQFGRHDEFAEFMPNIEHANEGVGVEPSHTVELVKEGSPDEKDDVGVVCAKRGISAFPGCS